MSQLTLPVTAPAKVSFSLSNTMGYEELVLLNQGLSNTVITFQCGARLCACV